MTITGVKKTVSAYKAIENTCLSLIVYLNTEAGELISREITANTWYDTTGTPEIIYIGTYRGCYPSNVCTMHKLSKDILHAYSHR